MRREAREALTEVSAIKSSFRNKLVFKIPMRIILLITVVMVAICIVLSLILSQKVTGYVQDKIEIIAKGNADEAVKYLENMEAKANALAHEVARYKNFDKETSEKTMKEALSSILKDDRIFSAYISLEPNLYYPNTPNGQGYYAFRDGSDIKLDIMQVYDLDSTADYYALAKSTNTVHVTEPYEYTLSTGETIWLISMSCPILDKNGKFLGVTNCDIKTDTLNSLEYDLGGYKTSYSSILTGKGKYVANTADKSLMGSTFTAEGEIGEKVLTASANGERLFLEGKNSVNGEESLIILFPVNISNVEETWSSVFVVSKSEALKDVSTTVLIVAVIALISLVVLAILCFAMLRKSLKPMDKIVKLATDMGNGILDTDIRVDTKDELGDLARIMKNTSNILNSYIGEISLILNKISEGDFRVAVEQDYLGDFLPIKTSLNNILDALNQIFKKISMAAEQVSAGSGEVSNGSQVLAQGATEQASSIEELSASIATIAEQVKQNAANAVNANSQMSVVGTDMEKSNQQMDKMLNAMTEINESSTQIAKIIKAIEDIAFQTNILALNAAVEAARAGAAGKGFAVVADEVRNLAGKSAQAATDTTALISTSVESVEGGMKIAEETANALREAVTEVKGAMGLIEQISDASNEQAASIEQITQGVEQISAVVQTNSATAEESAAASEELSGQANLLNEEISKVTLRD
ncbi:MAG: methyl-accepting chemotaxis protein [Clostridia bacterium]|nr:methyl-accepting chemotaxis protein [Clostridia bacterium]